MKRVFLGGNHPRHLYYASKLNEKFGFDKAILEDRGSMIVPVPHGLDERDKKNFVNHFADRYEAEQKYFGEPDLDCPTELVPNINVEFPKADQYIVFGCGLIKKPIRAINLHLGLSPRYRGAATLFWPFYFLEPQFAGVTFHYIVDEPDAGDIIHQCRPTLEVGDGIHDVACKAVLKATEDALELFETNGWLSRCQKSTGKNFLASDFQPQHLRMIYDVYDNDIVDHYLAGRLSQKEPRLHVA